MGLRAVIATSLTLLSACAAQPLMTLDECSKAEVCRVKGVMTIKEKFHVRMGHLTLPDGSCVDVSLPRSTVEEIGDGSKRMVVAGRVMPDPFFDGDVWQVWVNGRRVGTSICGGFYIFDD